MEVSIDIGRIFKRLYKMLWLVALITVIATAAGVAYTWNAKPDIYEAKVTLVGAPNGSYSESIGNTYIMRNYADLVKSERVARQVIQALPQYNLTTQSIQSMVKASFNANKANSTSTEDSALFIINTKTPDYNKTIAVANTTAEAFVSELKSVSGVDIAIIVDKASTAAIVYNGKTHQLLARLEFTAAGFMLICVVLGFIELMSKSVTQVMDCTLNGTIELIGVIPKYKIE